MSDQYKPASWAVPPSPSEPEAAGDDLAPPVTAVPEEALNAPATATSAVAEPPPAVPPAHPASSAAVAEYLAHVQAVTGHEPVLPRRYASGNPASAEDEDEWAQWQVSQGQWRQILLADMRRTLMSVGMIVGGLLILSIGFIAYYNGRLIQDSWRGLLVGLIVATGVLAAYHTWRLVRLWRGPHTVRIGPRQVHVGTQTWTLQGKEQELSAAEFRPGRPAYIIFKTRPVQDDYPLRRWERQSPLTEMIYNANKRRTIWVPVPAGHEAEGATLAQNFTRSGAITVSPTTPWTCTGCRQQNLPTTSFCAACGRAASRRSPGQDV